jgi:hypothetical protein
MPRLQDPISTAVPSMQPPIPHLHQRQPRKDELILHRSHHLERGHIGIQRKREQKSVLRVIAEVREPAEQESVGVGLQHGEETVGAQEREGGGEAAVAAAVG